MGDRVNVRVGVNDRSFSRHDHPVLHETLTHHRVDLRKRHDVGVHDSGGVGIHLLLLGRPVDQDKRDVLGLIGKEETYAVCHQLECFANRKGSGHEGNTRRDQVVLRDRINVVPTSNVVENTLGGDQLDGGLFAN